MLPLTAKELKSHPDARVCYICRKRILKKFAYGHCDVTGRYRSDVHSVCNLKFNVLSEILVVFHHDSNYDYHFIIKELAN